MPQEHGPPRRRFPGGDVVALTAAGGGLSAGILAAAARLEGRGAWRPLNATSHWLNGDGAADRTGPTWSGTGVGLATHLAATAFWAALHRAWAARGPATPRAAWGKAAALAGVSALVDYRATPRRFTPGWERVLSPAAMAAAYFAMGAGFAAVALRRRR